MRHENGELNERIVELSRSAGAERFVYISVSYKVAKAFEGPIEGYLDGKRQAEEAVARCFGDQSLVVGPSLVYGGGRFAAFGRILEASCDSPPVRGYLKTNAALGGLSSSAIEDWFTQALLEPPVEVDLVARSVAAGGKSRYEPVTNRSRTGYGRWVCRAPFVMRLPSYTPTPQCWARAVAPSSREKRASLTRRVS
jgi:hypothetical protein